MARALPGKPTYVSLGCVFPTSTKPKIDIAGLDYVRSGLATLRDTGVGHVAIGGITRDNVTHVLAAGAQCVAIGAGVTGAASPSDTCKWFKEKLDEHFAKHS